MHQSAIAKRVRSNMGAIFPLNRNAVDQPRGAVPMQVHSRPFEYARGSRLSGFLKSLVSHLRATGPAPLVTDWASIGLPREGIDAASRSPVVRRARSDADRWT